ncbi:DUF202 domain-containing protein [Corynebacterium sp.]|uniref:DUF202 domain-containing protein n=1 Tax=Corynebacterium sp. TaxID=1720 RepID=UPI002A91110F|nr:DUF202 domain-containing protein [Corynebacterium sp.]MDY5785341.1 DUF202 domain-containing protein [Corynebacterium sp.]
MPRTYGPIPVADAGLQPERTALSWVRTALAMLITSMTLLRWSAAFPRLVAATVALLAALALAIMVVTRPAYRAQAQALSMGKAHVNVLAVGLTTVLMLVLGVMGLYLVLAAQSR